MVSAGKKIYKRYYILHFLISELFEVPSLSLCFNY